MATGVFPMQSKARKSAPCSRRILAHAADETKYNGAMQRTRHELVMNVPEVMSSALVHHKASLLLTLAPWHLITHYVRYDIPSLPWVALQEAQRHEVCSWNWYLSLKNLKFWQCLLNNWLLKWRKKKTLAFTTVHIVSSVKHFILSVTHFFQCHPFFSSMTHFCKCALFLQGETTFYLWPIFKCDTFI